MSEASRSFTDTKDKKPRRKAVHLLRSHTFRQFLFIVLASPLAPGSQLLAEQIASGEYSVTQSWSQEQNYERLYFVRVPDHDDQEKFPVFIFLHGNGGNARRSMDRFLRSHPTMARKYVTVFAEGYQKSWNIVSERSKADDRGFIEEIVRKLATFENLQADNFSIMGNSNGAALVNQMAIETKLPNIRNYVSAVSPLNVFQHDGEHFKAKGEDNNYRQIANPELGKRLLNISGTEDKLVPYRGGPSKVIPAKDGKLAFVDAEESVFLWAQQMGARGKKLVDPRREGNLEIFSYLDGNVVHIKVTGAGHGAGGMISERRLLAFLEGAENATADPPDLAPIGLQKQLLVDDYVIAEKQNVTRELGEPKKVGIVMRPSVPTDFDPVKKYPNGLPESGGYYEFGRRLSVVWNKRREKFQMLYRASAENMTGYAESSDGIHWTKPLVSQDGKSNLITFRRRNRGTFYEASFMIDPTLPWGHPEKYKAAYNPGNTKCALGYSADGIHWSGYNDGKSATGRAADTFNQILWDHISRRYMFLTRTDLGADGGLEESRSTRIMVHEEGNDLMAWPTAWKTLANINVDDPKRRKSVNGVPMFQMESMNVWPYENVYFGLMHVLTAGELTGAEGRIDVEDPDKRHDADVIDYFIGTSRDGANYDKTWIHAQKPFVPRGPSGSFDKGMLQPSPEIITRGDEHLIFYTGQFNRHHSPKSTKRETGKIGLAKLPLDRFIGFRAGDEIGTLITKPFELDGDQLLVNVAAENGWIQIELLDASGSVMPGCSTKHERVDELRLDPNWVRLAKLKGTTVKLKFTLRNAKLYAFDFNWKTVAGG